MAACPGERVVACFVVGIWEVEVDELDMTVMTAVVVVSTTALPNSLTFANVAMATWLRKIVRGHAQTRKKNLLHLKNKIK